MNSRKWTRREFGSAALAVAGTAAAVRYGFAEARATRGLAFVGSHTGQDESGGSLHAFLVDGDRWHLEQTLATAAPAHLVAHPTLPVLYAVHNVGTWDCLPRGAVSTYRFHRSSGLLTHLHTQPLSLAATHPPHAVLTAGASHLFVAAEGGGIYNLLPVAADGTLRPPSAIRKEFGMEQNGMWKAAAPNSVALLPDGSLLAADAGQETLTSFSVQDGLLVLNGRTRVHRGEGPAHLTLSPDGSYAYTAGAAQGLVRRHTLIAGRAADETTTGQRHQVPVAPVLAHVPDAVSLLVI